MIRAAGILFQDPAGKVLLMKRGAGSDHPNEWVTPGGQAEEGETLEACAKRESFEEAGPLPAGRRIEFTRRIAPALGTNPTGPSPEPDVQAGEVPPPETAEQVDFTTFLQRVEEQFTPVLNYEHNAWGWFDPKEPPTPLHPGTDVALRRLTMNELDVADAMAAGELTSPQRYSPDLTLFAMRITGTGLAYRSAGKEHVWRDASIYMNEAFLRRCAALPVIWEHPEMTMLTTKEYHNRSIGAIFVAYFKGDDEVWGIAKIHDNDAAELMAKHQLSTSPGVTIKSADSGRLTEGDKTILIEGNPFVLDHLAVCEQGVWDKQGPPVGIQSDEIILKDSIKMPEDDKKDAGGNIDMVLSRLDSFNHKFDAMQAKIDAFEKDAKDTKDAKDAEEDDKRRDAWKKDAAAEDCNDADFEKKCDAWEAGEKNKDKDKAKDARKDASDARKDRMKDAKDKKDAKDAEATAAEAKKAEGEKMDADKKDADGVSQTMAELLAGMRALQANQPLPQTAPEFANFGDAIRVCDEALIPHSLRARLPHVGETVASYLDSVLTPVKAHSDVWGDIDIRSLVPKLQMIAAKQIKDSSVTASMSTVGFKDGELREVTVPSGTGHMITTFRGNSTFIRNFSAPSKRGAGKFLTQRAGA